MAVHFTHVMHQQRIDGSFVEIGNELFEMIDAGLLITNCDLTDQEQ